MKLLMFLNPWQIKWQINEAIYHLFALANFNASVHVLTRNWIVCLRHHFNLNNWNFKISKIYIKHLCLFRGFMDYKGFFSAFSYVQSFPLKYFFYFSRGIETRLFEGEDAKILIKWHWQWPVPVCFWQHFSVAYFTYAHILIQ